MVLLGIPALAGLSTLHAFVPPHPGPLTAIGALNANLGITLALGLIVAIPTVIISGPLFGSSPPSGFRSQLRRTRLRPKLRNPRKTARPSAPPCP